MALATSRVVAAPSIWEEVIASSISELSRWRSREEGVVTASGAITLAPAFMSIPCRPLSSSGGWQNQKGLPSLLSRGSEVPEPRLESFSASHHCSWLRPCGAGRWRNSSQWK